MYFISNRNQNVQGTFFYVPGQRQPRNCLLPSNLFWNCMAADNCTSPMSLQCLWSCFKWQVRKPRPSNTFFLHTMYIQVFVPAWSYSGEMVDLLLPLQLLFICLAAVVVVLSHFFHCWTTSRLMQTLSFAFLAQGRHIRFNREKDRQKEGVREAKWLNPWSLNANVCLTTLAYARPRSNPSTVLDTGSGMWPSP